jgi:hypothetical protein
LKRTPPRAGFLFGPPGIFAPGGCLIDMESESLWSLPQFVAYGAILLAAVAGIAVPLMKLRTRKRQGPPRGPRHTDPAPGPSTRSR